MRTRATVIGIGLLVTALAALSGPARAQDEIRLGAFAPLSGISADVGAQIKAGTEVALERIAEISLGGQAAPRAASSGTTRRGRATSASTR